MATCRRFSGTSAVAVLRQPRIRAALVRRWSGKKAVRRPRSDGVSSTACTQIGEHKKAWLCQAFLLVRGRYYSTILVSAIEPAHSGWGAVVTSAWMALATPAATTTASSRPLLRGADRLAPPELTVRFPVQGVTADEQLSDGHSGRRRRMVSPSSACRVLARTWISVG